MATLKLGVLGSGAGSNMQSIVDAIGKVKTGFAGMHQNVPETAVVIKKVTVAD